MVKPITAILLSRLSHQWRAAATLVVALFFAPHSTIQAIPNSFTYQGSLKQNGVPVNANGTSMQFKIYDVLAGGAPKWTTVQSVDIKEGLYRVELSPDGTLVNWESGEFYIETCLNGTCLSPREKLSSVPYALLAKDVIAGASAKGDFQVIGKLTGKGTVQVDGTLDSKGNAQVAGTLTAGKLLVPVGSAASPTLTFSNDTNTGVYLNDSDSIGFSVGGTRIAVLGTPAKGGLVMTGGAEMNTNAIKVNRDNAFSIGSPGARYIAVWAVYGAIQTSSFRNKREIREIAMASSGISITPIALPEGAVSVPSLASPSGKSLGVPRSIIFKWKGQEGKPTDQDVIGFMGDDLPLEAHAIKDDGTRDPDNFYTSSVIGILAAKVRAQDSVIKNLLERVAVLETEAKVRKER